MIIPPDLEPGMTTRERFAVHQEDPYCRGCHRQMDPIGLGFEHFDAIGRYRATENDLPIDDTGVIHDVGPGDVTFEGVPQLAAWLSDAPEVRDCMTRQWFRYAFGRYETAADACSIEEAHATFEAAGGDVRELLIALTQTDAFRLRPAIDPGDSP
jgi:hypothetical protein